jgi:PDZ domain
MKRSSLIAAVSCVIASSGVTAQVCSFGPGEVFGIIAYQCANCGFRRETPERPAFLFYAEPVVTEAKSPGVFRAGDVVEAVDGKPITTSAGAEQFTYPTLGEHTISVRRGRERQVLSVSISAPGGACAAPKRPAETGQSRDQIESIEVVKGPAAVARYGPDAVNGALIVTTTHKKTHVSGDSLSLRFPNPLRRSSPEPLIIIDGVRAPRPGDPNSHFRFSSPDPSTEGRFGFAVDCQKSCTSATTKEGTLQYTYYKYTGFPPVAAIRPNSPADRAGLKFGDLIVKVDGHPIGDEEGARILSKLDWKDTPLRLTVRRDDREFVITIMP